MTNKKTKTTLKTPKAKTPKKKTTKEEKFNNPSAPKNKEEVVLQNMQDSLESNSPQEVLIEELEEVQVLEDEVTPIAVLYDVEEEKYDESPILEEIESEGPSAFLDEKIDKEVEVLNEKMNVIDKLSQTKVEEDPEPKQELPIEEPKQVKINVEVQRMNIVRVTNNTSQTNISYSQDNIQSAINSLMTENKLTFIEARAIVEERMRRKESLIQKNTTQKPQQPTNKITVIPMKFNTNQK